MTQILNALPLGSNTILCCYVNATNQMQVVRIANIANWYFERVVFPQQRLFFEAPPDGWLEIHTSRIPTAILMDNIPCNSLQVKELAAQFI